MGALLLALSEAAENRTADFPRISSTTEQRVLEIIRAKAAGGVGMFVSAVRVAEQSYGQEAREMIRVRQTEEAVRRAAALGAATSDSSLRAYCRALEQACCGTHEWEKLEDSETRQAYRFGRCAWAEIFRSLAAEDIGIWICECDGPAAAAFNPAVRFRRTKTLMAGDDCCDHVYYTE
jgi:hypothetical protein